MLLDESELFDAVQGLVILLVVGILKQIVLCIQQVFFLVLIVHEVLCLAKAEELSFFLILRLHDLFILLIFIHREHHRWLDLLTLQLSPVYAGEKRVLFHLAYRNPLPRLLVKHFLK